MCPRRLLRETDEPGVVEVGRGVDLLSWNKHVHRDLLEDVVTGEVAVLVVHLLEVIDVQEHQAEEVAVGVRLGARLLDAFVKGAAIRQPGEGIRRRLLADRLKLFAQHGHLG